MALERTESRRAAREFQPAPRQTRPSYYDGISLGGKVTNGGLGVIARRGWDPATSGWLADLADGKFTGAGMLGGGLMGGLALQDVAETMPLRLLRVLVAQHETAGMALSNDLSFTFRPGAMRVVAVKDYKDGKGKVDDGETAHLDRLWAGCGGLPALQKTLARQQTTDGLSALECVIGDGGVSDIIDFDGLSVKWGKDRTLLQVDPASKTGFRELDQTLVRCSAWLGSRENPYGEPRFGRFLGVGLADISEQRSLRDWLHAMAWPRIVFEFPIEAWTAYAAANPKDCCTGKGPVDPETGVATDLTATQWAEGMVAYMQGVCESLTSSDFITMATGGKASALNISPGGGVAELLAQRRLRLSQSLDHPPALIGITDGGTQAYASVQLRQYGAKLTAVAEGPDRDVEWAANLDLRARGVDMIARVEREPIVLTDALIDQQARRLELLNVFSLVDRGFTSPEDAAMMLTGSGVYDETRVYAAVNLGSDPAPAKNAA